jgi:hypothetical protein
MGERPIKPMTIIEQLRDVKGTAFIKLSKDERLMVGELCHLAAAEIERLRVRAHDHFEDFRKLAVEVSRLRAALARIGDERLQYDGWECAKIAREALGIEESGNG